MMHPDILRAVAQTRVDDRARRGTPKPVFRRWGRGGGGGASRSAAPAPLDTSAEATPVAPTAPAEVADAPAERVLTSHR